MADVFSKRPIDFSKYRELLSDDNPKIPDDQISRDSYKQNQGDSIGSSPVGNVPQNETKNPSTLDQKKMEDSQQLNAQPRVRYHVDMSPQMNLTRDEHFHRVNTYKSEEPKPWELSEDESDVTFRL